MSFFFWALLPVVATAPVWGSLVRVPRWPQTRMLFLPAMLLHLGRSISQACVLSFSCFFLICHCALSTVSWPSQWSLSGSPAGSWCSHSPSSLVSHVDLGASNPNSAHLFLYILPATWLWHSMYAFWGQHLKSCYCVLDLFWGLFVQSYLGIWVVSKNWASVALAPRACFCAMITVSVLSFISALADHRKDFSMSSTSDICHWCIPCKDLSSVTGSSLGHLSRVQCRTLWLSTPSGVYNFWVQDLWLNPSCMVRTFHVLISVICTLSFGQLIIPAGFLITGRAWLFNAWILFLNWLLTYL